MIRVSLLFARLRYCSETSIGPVNGPSGVVPHCVHGFVDIGGELSCVIPPIVGHAVKEVVEDVYSPDKVGWVRDDPRRFPQCGPSQECHGFPPRSSQLFCYLSEARR